jgi:uncharacterized protein YkwD
MPASALLRILPAAFLATLAAAAPAHAVTARAATAACPDATALPAAGNVGQVERATLCLINLEREQRGLGAVRSNDRLARAADAHSRDMVARDFFSHDSRDGGTMSSRIKGSGYLNRARSYALGENIAWATGDLGVPLKIHQAWMRSPGHRANILSRAFDEVGVGIVVGAPGRGGEGATYTTDFGKRS